MRLEFLQPRTFAEVIFGAGWNAGRGPDRKVFAIFRHEAALTLPQPSPINENAERALCNGKTLAFQARDTGSIPVARSKASVN